MNWREAHKALQKGDWQALLHPDMAMLIVGALLLIAGARIYRLVIIAPGFVCGALIATNYVSGSQEVKLIVTLVAGIVGAIILTKLEKLALAIVGALLTAGLVYSVAPFIGVVQWYVPVIAGFVGSLVFPYVYKKALPISTALLGALCIGWSTGLSQDPVMICVFWVGGIVVQTMFGGKLKDKVE
jgi:hypothetical protein